MIVNIGMKCWINVSILAVSFVIFTAGITLAQNNPQNALKVGVCQRDITPISPGLADEYEAAFGGPAVVNHTDPIFIAGFGDNRRATNYNDRLWARGVVLESGATRIAIVSLDLIGYTKQEVDTARASISPSSEIDFAVISSTHQHEGPDTLGIWGPDPLTSGVDPAYLDFVNAAVADCIDEAATSLVPSRVQMATGNSAGLSLGFDAEDDGFGVADSKVLVDDDLIAPDTSGRIVDPNIGVIQFSRLMGPPNVLATIVNFASHPESLGSGNTLISSDFPHYVRERIEAEYGGTAIWLSGALGVLQGPLDIDVLDPITNQPAARRTFRFAEVHGTQLAERAIATINAVGRNRARNNNLTPEIGFSHVDPVPVRLDNPFTRFFKALGVLSKDLFTNGTLDNTVGFPFPPPFDTIPQALGDDVHTEVSALRIGNGAFAVVPTEVDPQIGFGYRDRLVAATGAEHTFIIGLGNDEIGYQLPAAKWDDSCHFCAPFVLAGVPQLCPLFPNIDCNTVFQDNLGADVDPAITPALEGAIDGL